ncbi:hypothetical protein C8Q76DRAFT_608661 [Earliella scabrosa]|nr:hypothetical protein C8Q76DRAFT_608661 [Earliella scabrosa]
MPTKLFAPNINYFAVVRLNPIVMVQDLDDPEALAEARAMSTKKYLVFLVNTLWLPMPANPWHAYTVKPIAPTLRVENLSRGLTSDMVVPIAPNTSHPRGRAPIHTDTPFPFSNCYFWHEYELNLRVIARPEMFEHANAVALGTAAYFQMNREFGDDILRSLQIKKQHAPEPQSAPEPPTAPETVDSGNVMNAILDHATGMPALDLFGDDADPMQAELIPLVDLWLDLTAHLTEATIPNPEGFIKETDTIVS